MSLLLSFTGFRGSLSTFFAILTKCALLYSWNMVLRDKSQSFLIPYWPEAPYPLYFAILTKDALLYFWKKHSETNLNLYSSHLIGLRLSGVSFHSPRSSPLIRSKSERKRPKILQTIDWLGLGSLLNLPPQWPTVMIHAYEKLALDATYYAPPNTNKPVFETEFGPSLGIQHIGPRSQPSCILTWQNLCISRIHWAFEMQTLPDRLGKYQESTTCFFIVTSLDAAESRDTVPKMRSIRKIYEI